MHVAEIWRYPVKSMAGESLTEAAVTALGIDGDRAVHVQNSRGRVVTARTFPRLLGHGARLGTLTEPLIDGRLWTEPDVLAEVVDIVGPGARLVRNDTADRFDVLPLLVATDGAIHAFGYAGRRLRPNIIVAGVDGLDERTWEGKSLQIGEVRIGLQDLRARCVMTTIDPDTLDQDPNVLMSIVRRFEGKLALNARVLAAGTVHVGEEVQLV